MCSMSYQLMDAKGANVVKKVESTHFQCYCVYMHVCIRHHLIL
jgi:hypothetical protein